MENNLPNLSYFGQVEPYSRAFNSRLGIERVFLMLIGILGTEQPCACAQAVPGQSCPFWLIFPFFYIESHLYIDMIQYRTI